MCSIDFIYFDLGNVILNFDHRLACRQIESITGVSSEQVNSLIFDSGLQIKYETGEISSFEFYESSCQAMGCRPEQARFLNAFSDIFEWNTRLIPLMAQLAASGFPIGILSNTCAAHWELICDQYKLISQIFPVAILSYEVQSMKPDATIYTRAVEEAACDSARCFFVDDRDENVAGARQAGMDAVLYESLMNLLGQLADRGVEFNL